MLSPPTRAKTSLIYPMARGPVHDVGAQQYWLTVIDNKYGVLVYR